MATGHADWTASETIRSTQQKTEFHNQVVLTGYSPISYDMNNIQNSTGGAFQVNGEALFHNVVCISGRSTKGHSGNYRAYGLGGNAIYTSSGNYSLIIGGQGRILCGVGSELNTYSDIREKQDVETYDGMAALETVKNVRSVQFAYKKQPEQRRYGFIAQELTEYVPEIISVVSGLKDEQDDRLVLNKAGMVPVLWAALKEVIMRLEKLEK